MNWIRTLNSPASLMLAGSMSLLIVAGAGCTRDATPSNEDCGCDAMKSDEAVAGPIEGTHATHYALPGLDHGLLQSPVNILSTQAVDGTHRVAPHFDHAAPDYVVNTGHTIELDFPTGSSITFDGNEYDLKQLHFHTPSEHQVDGTTYPMEMHIVSQMDPAPPGTSPEYLVVAILFRMGDSHPFIESFLDQVPPSAGRKHVELGEISVDQIDLSSVREVFHYRGSLTTPPYTEAVHWLVLKQIVEASPEQIRRINVIEGDNARHIQALVDRKIDE